jgi:hypothetical protein
VLCLVVLLGAACTGPSGQTGSLTVNLKDGPYADAMAMLVTFKGVSAHHADAEWQPLTFARGVTTPLTCDLKKLVNVVDVLGAGQLLAGHYTQLRVEVQSAALYSSPTPEADPACAATMCRPRPHCQCRDPIGRGEAQSTIHDTGGRGDEDPARLRW